jgi:hypothetical protein
MAGAGDAGGGTVVFDFDHVQGWGFLVWAHGTVRLKLIRAAYPAVTADFVVETSPKS